MFYLVVSLKLNNLESQDVKLEYTHNDTPGG